MRENKLNYEMIGKRIRAARTKLGITQEEVSLRTGNTKAYLSHIETGKGKLALPTIVKIANALSVSVNELLCDNMVEVKDVYDMRFTEELSDCDADELVGLLEQQNIKLQNKTSHDVLTVGIELI